jgi:hypothetical protein
MDREAQIVNAIEAYKTGQFKYIRQAAREYNVHPSTLSRRLRGSTSIKEANATKQAVAPGEEKALLDWIQRCQAQGFPIRHDMIKAMAEYIIAKRNQTVRRQTLSIQILSHNWTSRFVKRHPFLSSIMSKPIEQARNKACTREAFEKWFNLYRKTTTTFKVQQSNIYNIDETGFQMGDSAKSYVIIDKRLGTQGYTGRGATTENITVVECGCMDGSALPPFIIFKGANLQSTWYYEKAPENWMAVTSENGWTNNLLGYTWLTKLFDPHTNQKASGQYRILVLDGHGSHVTPEFLEYCEEHKIIVLCLPAHTSHILQPMDRVFPSVKHWFRREGDSHLRFGAMRVSKAEFMKIYHKTRPLSVTKEHILSGFRKTGLNPFNPALALQQLPAAAASPPWPLIPIEFQTPKTLQQLHYAINKAEEVDKGASETREKDLRLIRTKIEKAATQAMAGEEILKRELTELKAFQAEKSATGSRKRRRVLGNQALTVGEAVERMEAIERGGRQVRKTMTTRRRQNNKKRKTIESEEDTSEEDSDSGESDISSVIICLPRS